MFDSIQRFLGIGDCARNFGGVRSNQWPSVRAAHLLKEPKCQLTGATNDLEVHHIRPFHLHPELELDPENLITLTTNWKGINIHLVYGHWHNFCTKYNPNIRIEAPKWFARFNSPMDESL